MRDKILKILEDSTDTEEMDYSYYVKVITPDKFSGIIDQIIMMYDPTVSIWTEIEYLKEDDDRLIQYASITGGEVHVTWVGSRSYKDSIPTHWRVYK